MKILDANLLLYAINQDAPLHLRARTWLESTLSGGETVGFSWNVILAFLRLSTRPTVFARPLRTAEAFDVCMQWLQQPGSLLIQPGDRHLTILRDLVVSQGTGGNLVSDAHLAALAIEHGAELCTCDADFARFTGLRWQNPLAGEAPAR